MSNVVIVDDQSSNRKILSRLVASLKPEISIEAFGDPLEALAYSRERTPDLLVTDFKMPSLNGAEFIGHFRAIPECLQVPAIVVTAYEDIEFRTLALQAGANEFVLSPLDHVEFCAQSRKLLDMRHSKLRETPPNDMDACRQSISSVLAQATVAGGNVDLYNHLLENVSAKLLGRVAELNRVSAQLEDLLEINATPAIFVDQELLIRRFTPQITSIYSVTPQDIGGPLNNIQFKLDCDNITDDVQRAIQTGQIIELYQDQRSSRARYLVRIIPTRGANDIVLGAMLIFAKVAGWFEPTMVSRLVH